MLGPLALALPLGCGDGSVPSPFGPPAGGAGGEAGAEGKAGFSLDVDAGDGVDWTLGGPCRDDGQCDDGVACTRDACDAALKRCRFTPDDDACDDGVYCNGVERCDLREGCGPGEPVACSDNSTCTIDTCVEETRSCRHEPRDADGDGEPTHNCGGTDCDDSNPRVNQAANEICGNGRDDDCDGSVDEPDCTTPEHDTCADPLLISAAGFYDVDLAGTALDYPSACATEPGGFRDGVLTLSVPEGGPYDVDVTAKVDAGKLALTYAESCGATAATTCEPFFVTPLGARVSRLLLRGLGAGEHSLYVAADTESTVQLLVDYRPAEAQLGELCEDAVPLSPGGAAATVRLPGYRDDFDSSCEPQQPPGTRPENRRPLTTGDAFFGFSLEQASDVTLVAEAQAGLGLPVLMLLDAGCSRQLTCRRSQPARLFARNLPPGEYRVGVAGTAPDDVNVRLEVEPVSEAPPGEGCQDVQTLSSGVEELVDLFDREDAVDPQCLPGAPDASFGFELEGKRDVMLVGRFSAGDEGAVSIAGLGCDSNLACSSGPGTRRVARYGLSPGPYRAIIESAQGNPVGLSWFERPALAAVHVAFADDCDGLVTIPEVGGRFSGNTSNAFPDFDAGCDRGGQAEGGAPDQLLRLRLSRARRVIFDMRGSGYATLLSVRQGQFCPGAELPRSCTHDQRQDSPSFLDLDLPAGDYFVQIDGFDGAAGPWKLDVFTAPL